MSDKFRPSDYPEVKRGRPSTGAIAKPRAEIRKQWKARKKAARIEDIAILDFETDPFDNTKPDEKIYPFCAVLYSDDFEPIIIWELDHNKFVDCVIAAIENLPKAYTIYAHNGGKFDYMFLLHKMRGFVQFKGRGLMTATIGLCELRDSFHIIPERLANWQKDDFDYTMLYKKNRLKNKQAIITYCINDCKYLLDIVKSFVKNHGFKLSIGQAAISQLRKHYNVARISEYQDGGTDGKLGLRQYFFGGRVECLAGRGKFFGNYKLFDVNSMYPAVMANCRHPIGNEYAPRKGEPSSYTAFVRLSCRNYGALVKRGEAGETTADVERGIFTISKFEYDTALKYDLIEDVEIIECIDCNEFSDFSKFVIPLYENRLSTKALLKTLPQGSRDYNEAKKDDIFYKLLLNNCYGKFAQNPRRFRERFISDIGERPPQLRDDPVQWPELPSAENGEYAIWERESRPWRFFNVGTGASITGAARAVLLEAIQNADDPIYCDTDSIICRDLRNVEIDPVKLGAWDIEAEFDEVIIAGKKMYACRTNDPVGYGPHLPKVKSKGVAGLKWDDMQRLLDEQVSEAYRHVIKTARGVTLTNDGRQHYMKRKVRATAPNYTQRSYHARRAQMRAL